MSERKDYIQNEFMKEIGKLADNLGMPHSTGQIYALLYMNPEPVSLDRMAEICNMSKSCVVSQIEELEEWKAVRRVETGDDGKACYEAERDIPRIIIRRLQATVPPHLNALSTLLKNTESEVEKVDQNEKDKKQFYQARIKEIHRLTRGVQRLVNNMERLYNMGRRFM